MNLGIIASASIHPVTGGGGGAPVDSLLHCDFMAGEYFVGSTPITLSDVLSGTPTVSASGVYVNSQQHMTGLALAAVLDQEYYAIVVEWSFATHVNSTPFVMENTTTFAGFEIFAQWSSAVGSDDFADVSGPAAYWNPGAPEGFEVPSPVRAAVDRTAGRIAVSVNGSAAIVATGATVVVSGNAVTLGGSYGFGGFDGYVRKITLYASATDAELATLSAL